MRQLDNELITRTGPGTLMGNLLRQYWIPALKSSEVQIDQAPLRLRLLGENLVAFRTTSGRVGVFDHRCPHRCASLFFGRNEADGIRCVYHGWKFDVDGNCVETPTEAAESTLKNQIHATSYTTQERGGVVWVYMGNAAKLPELPHLEANFLPEGQRWVVTGMRACNWLQALEGDIDTAHLSFLHLGALAPEDFPPGSPAFVYQNDRAPRFEVDETPYGTMYGAYRPGGDKGDLYWRIAHFLMPFWTMPPGGPLQRNIVARAWVPIDDEHTMFWHLSAPIPERPPIALADKSGKSLVGIHFNLQQFLPNTSDWLGRFRYLHNADNDYGMDREVQRTQSFTGIDGVHNQDQAITESMGAIVDRTREHLGSSDKMIILTRRNLLKAAQMLRDNNTTPDGVENPAGYNMVRAGEMITPAGADWRKAYRTICESVVTTHAGFKT